MDKSIWITKKKVTAGGWHEWVECKYCGWMFSELQHAPDCPVIQDDSEDRAQPEEEGGE